METIAETLHIDAPGGRMTLEGHRPDEAGPLPGVLVLMDAFGVDAHIRCATERLATEGYLALAPDLYYRERERTIDYADLDRAADRVMRTIALSDAPEERVKDERVLKDIAAALGALSEHPQVDPARIGVLGFGMGGRLALLAACRQSDIVRTAVVFCGGGIVSVLSEARALRGPVLLIFAGLDRTTPLPHIDRIQAELGYLGKPHEIRVVPTAQQGFFCEGRSTYDRRAAEDAWQRAGHWLLKHLA